MLRGVSVRHSVATVVGLFSVSCALLGCGDSATGAGGAGGSASSVTGATNASNATQAAATNAAATNSAAGVTSSSTGTPVTFPCSGTPLPTTAPAMITVGGDTTTVGLSGTSAVPAAALEVFIGAATTPFATTTSDGAGKYEFTLPTNGVPQDGYIHAKKSGFLDTYLYPPSALAADTPNGTVLLLPQATLDLLSQLESVTQTAGNGFIGVVVTDCSQNPIAGATVTTSSAGSTVRYNSGGAPNNQATSTDTDGLAYVFNAVPGTVTVQASVGATVLRQHDIQVRADVVTTTLVVP